MNCSSNVDLKAYVVGEVSRQERSAVEDHVRGCQGCREELDRLNLTRSALAMLEDEEIPRRIAFVSDRVFEPRWWQTMWQSGPVMGFASAVLLAGAILVHGFTTPAVPPVVVTDTAQIQQRIDAAVSKAVNASEAKQAAKFASVLQTTEARFEHQRQEDLATVQQAADYYQRQIGRLEMASNQGAGQ
jgi:anti-sigma factor RsiW